MEALRSSFAFLIATTPLYSRKSEKSLEKDCITNSHDIGRQLAAGQVIGNTTHDKTEGKTVKHLVKTIAFLLFSALFLHLCISLTCSLVDTKDWAGLA